MRKILLSLIFCLSTASWAVSAPLSSVVATVNGDPITSRELDRAAAPEIAGARLDPAKAADQEKITEIKRRILDTIVTDKILRQEADRQGINVSEEMVDEEMAAFLAANQLSEDDFRKIMEQQGLSADFMRERMKSNLTNQILLGRNVYRKIIISEDEVNAYFEQNAGRTLREQIEPAPQPVMQPQPDEPRPPFKYNRVRIAILVYPKNANAEEWARKIAAGETTFARVARQVSVGPNAADGGDMGSMPSRDLAEGLAFVASMLRPGEVSPLLEMGELKAQIRLMDAAPKPKAPEPKPIPKPEPQYREIVIGHSLDSQTAGVIEDLIRKPKLEERYEAYVQQLRNKAIIDIRI